MDLRLLVPPAAICLVGVVKALRQIFRPQFDLPDDMISALGSIDRTEQPGLTPPLPLG